MHLLYNVIIGHDDDCNNATHYYSQLLPVTYYRQLLPVLNETYSITDVQGRSL